jgi:hypothetical protein
LQTSASIPTRPIAATRLLLRIAHVDGARTAEEVALIRLFYDSGRARAPPARISIACNRPGRAPNSPVRSARRRSVIWWSLPA